MHERRQDADARVYSRKGAVFASCPNKQMTTGEAGVATTGDRNLATGRRRFATTRSSVR